MVNAIKGMMSYFIASIVGLLAGYVLVKSMDYNAEMTIITIIVVLTLVGGLVNYNKKR